jgi:membrane-bound lytic murein transglycosylase B
MTKGGQFRIVAVAALMALACMSGKAGAAQCGNSAAGFDAWKRQTAEEARGRGIGAAGVSALLGTNYSSATIGADRGQHGFHVSLDAFLAKRGGSAIAARGRGLKASNAGLFASIQQHYGVPPGPLIAIYAILRSSAIVNISLSMRYV